MKLLRNLICCCVFLIGIPAAATEPPNILVLTVDDMNCDSVGVYGCAVPGTTPNIDRLAAESLRFDYAHVVVGNCMPSRNVMFSGRYPHNNGVEGFYQIPQPKFPTATRLFREAGYFTAIRGKTTHSTPYHPYEWDLVADTLDGQKAHNKDPQSYFDSTKLALASARKSGKRFFININVSDPHKPFYGMGGGNKRVADPFKPSRIFNADEVAVPGFLFDHPDVRQELALYYSTVRRADDCVGNILRALKESGQQDNTLVLFLSDHGMPLPFAKTAVYHHSTRTPLMVRWPGVTTAGQVDQDHMVSAVDILPTLLDAAQLAHPSGFDGRSFHSLLSGGKQPNRDWIVKEYNENSGAGRHPMRSVESKRFCYIFNPWSDGKRVFKTATTGTATYRRLRQLAGTNTALAARLDMFDHRVVEEFYDVRNDPDCLHNLIDNPKFQKELRQHQDRMLHWMKSTNDHALKAFVARDNSQQMSDYVDEVQAQATARRATRRKGKKTNRRRKNLFKVELPQQVTADKDYTLRIPHKLPQKLDSQQLVVTLKDAAGNRLERQTLRVAGTETARIVFRIPADTQSVRFAAWIGKDFDSALQYFVSDPVPVK